MNKKTTKTKKYRVSQRAMHIIWRSSSDKKANFELAMCNIEDFSVCEMRVIIGALSQYVSHHAMLLSNEINNAKFNGKELQ